MYRSRTSASYSTPRGRLQIHQEKLQRHRIQLQIHNQGQRQVRLHEANSKHSREPTSGVSVPTPNTVRTSLQYVNLGRGGHALFILFALFKKTICNSHNLTPSLVGQCSVRDVFLHLTGSVVQHRSGEISLFLLFAIPLFAGSWSKLRFYCILVAQCSLAAR